VLFFYIKREDFIQEFLPKKQNKIDFLFSLIAQKKNISLLALRLDLFPGCLTYFNEKK
jgi:hypothetical protein